MKKDKNLFLCFGFILIYICVYWWRLLLAGTMPLDGDSLRLVYPSWYIGKRLLLDGYPFLWDPFRNMGIPFLASPPNQALYPIRFFSVFVNFLDYMRIFVVFHVLLLSGFTFLLIWKRKKDLLTALMAALAMGFNGYVLAQVTIMIDFATMAWIPALLYFLDSRKWVGFSVSLALQWLAGYPPLFAMSTFFVAATILTYEKKKPYVHVFIKGTMLGLGLTAVQWIPFLELVQNSQRLFSIPMQEVLKLSLHPLEFCRQFFIPAPFVNQISPIHVGDQAVTGFYFGPFLLILFYLGLVKGSRTGRVLGSLVLLGFFLSLGKYNGIYQHLRFLSFFRYPAMWLLVSTFGFVLVSVKGFESLKLNRSKWFFLIFISLDLLLFSYPIRTIWANMEFLTKAPTRFRIVDSVKDNRRIFHHASITNFFHLWRLKSGEDLKAMYRMMVPSLGVPQGFNEAWSRHQLPTKKQVRFKKRLDQAPFDSPLFDIAGIEKIIFVSNDALKESMPRLDDIQVTSNKNAYASVFQPNGGSVTILDSRPGSIRVQTKIPGLLVFNETHYPGWKAMVQNKPLEIQSYEETFLAVEVAEENSVVHFTYSPWTFKVGLTLSLLSLLVCFSPFLSRTKKGHSNSRRSK